MSISRRTRLGLTLTRSVSGAFCGLVFLAPLIACDAGSSGEGELGVDEAALGGGRDCDEDWTAFGGNIRNTRNADGEKKLDRRNVSRLAKKWEFNTLGDVSATPIVVDGSIYVTDWGGGIFRIRENGTAAWSKQVSDFDGAPGSTARGVTYSDNRIVFGTQPGLARVFAPFGPAGGAPLTYPPPDQRPEVVVVNATTGELIWKRQVDENPWATITGVPTVYDGRVYVGMSSMEEPAIMFYGAVPTFRGSVSCFDLRTGNRLWKRYTVPEGFTGGSIVGSGPALDKERGLLYVATNNGYTAPPEVMACAAAQSTPQAQEACLPTDVHIDSMMALDLRTGNIRWTRRLAQHFDIWNNLCLASPCLGKDQGFVQQPALIDVGGRNKELVGAGQKSGMYWALNPDTGATVWSRNVGPGGHIGGLQWGSATDDKRIYTALSNSLAAPHTLKNGQTVTSGSFAALDAKNGNILWQVPDPVGAKPWAPVSVANGVVYGCSGDAEGHMHALDAATGAVLWSFPSGGTCMAGPAINDGTVYWGTGYAHFVIYPENRPGPHKLYAFSVPGRH